MRPPCPKFRHRRRVCLLPGLPVFHTLRTEGSEFWEVNAVKRLVLAKNASLLTAAVCCALGVYTILLPWGSPRAAAVTGGAVLIACGAVRLLGYLSEDPYCLAFQHDLSCGALLIVLGVLTLSRLNRMLPYLSSGLGVLILLDGLLAVQTAVDAKRFGIRSWPALLAAAAAAAFCGIVLLADGSRAAAGAALVAGGVLRQSVVLLTVPSGRFREE